MPGERLAAPAEEDVVPFAELFGKPYAGRAVQLSAVAEKLFGERRGGPGVDAAIGAAAETRMVERALLRRKEAFARQGEEGAERAERGGERENRKEKRDLFPHQEEESHQEKAECAPQRSPCRGRDRVALDREFRLAGPVFGIGKIENLHHGYRDIVRSARKVCQTDERLNRLGGGEKAEYLSHFGVFDLAGKTVAAKEKCVPLFQGERPFEIDLRIRAGTERTGDDVLRNVGRELGRIDFSLSGQLPEQAVVESDLLVPPVSQAVGSAVPHVGVERPFGKEKEDVGGRAHAAERLVGLSLQLDLLMRVGDRVLNRFVRGLFDPFCVTLRCEKDGHLAGAFPGGVRSHPVGDHEEMAPFAPEMLAGGRNFDVRVLVVRPLHADVRDGGVIERG